MHHKMRWTQQKIKQRLELIQPLIYRKRVTLPSFRFQPLPDPVTPPDVGINAGDGGWVEILKSSRVIITTTNFQAALRKFCATEISNLLTSIEPAYCDPLFIKIPILDIICWFTFRFWYRCQQVMLRIKQYEPTPLENIYLYL